jgi:hypothetical protein
MAMGSLVDGWGAIGSEVGFSDILELIFLYLFFFLSEE